MYYYDQQNRLYKTRWPDASLINYTYDAAGRLTQVTDSTGTYTFTHDRMNRLIQTTTVVPLSWWSTLSRPESHNPGRSGQWHWFGWLLSEIARRRTHFHPGSERLRLQK